MNITVDVVFKRVITVSYIVLRLSYIFVLYSYIRNKGKDTLFNYNWNSSQAKIVNNFQPF